MTSSVGGCRSAWVDQGSMKPEGSSSGRLRAGIGIALLLGAFAAYQWAPWRGPIILSLSSTHGIDTGDLPAFALLAVAVAVGRRTWVRGAGRHRGGWRVAGPALHPHWCSARCCSRASSTMA